MVDETVDADAEPALISAGVLAEDIEAVAVVVSELRDIDGLPLDELLNAVGLGIGGQGIPG